MSWKEALLDLFFPPRCAWCGKVGVKGECPACKKALPYHHRPLHEGAAYGRCAAPLRYEGAAREGILRFKFRGAQTSVATFGALLARCADEQYRGEFDVVTWVPVSEKRRRERGFDQAELLAREMTHTWNGEPVCLLRKTRENAVQSRLGSADERRANVLGAYEAADVQRIRSKRVLLVDDILTTGATLGECARVLREAGAADVLCITLAAREREKEGRK